MKRLFLYLVFLLTGQQIFAQSPQASFTLPGQACLGERIEVTNQSSNALRYEWDLCQGDLQMTPIGRNVIAVPGNVTAGADLVFDGNNWYGFVTSRETNSVKRLDFGSDLNATPVITDLGNIGSISPWRPIDIQIIHDNGEWFGFVYGESSNLITRIDFGNSLANTSGLSAEVIITGGGNANCGLSIFKDGGNYVLAYSNSYAFGTAVLSHIRAVPSATEKMHTGNIPGILNFGDIKLIKHVSNWHAYIPAYGSQKLFQAKFGTDPLNTPVLSDISSGFIGSNSPFGIDIGVDNGQYMAILCTIDGVLMRINLGSDPDQPPLSGMLIGNLGVLGNTLKISLSKYFSSWKAITVSWNSGDLFTIEFPGPLCQEYPTVLTASEPQLSFQTAGSKHVSLRAFSGNSFNDAHQSITITGSSAPSIQISVNGICTQSDSQFGITSEQSLTSTSWSFGDSFTSTLPNPTHQYASSGEYLVSLQVTAENGCNNYTEKTIKIYDPPDALFTSPTGLICTNNEFTFVNNTIDQFDGNLSYEWYVNDQLASPERDLKFTFSETGDQTVKLKTIIPGCSDEQTQTVSNVQSGPTVAFDFSGKCQNESIAFANQSAGSISSYQWDFADGSQSDAENPAHLYAQPGTYSVYLHTTGTNGCVSSLSKQVNIYSKPQTDFSLDLPPFSCSGSPSQFHDTTPSMPDSNTDTWLWTFGDGSGSTSKQKNPVYTFAVAGDYPVSLTTTTNFGCSNSVLKTVTIAPSPVADFTFGPACVNQGTAFSDRSTSDVKAWQWTIQSASYATKNPVHIFTAAASYQATLTVTAQNNCLRSVTKTVTVPVQPSLDFSSVNTCATRLAEFTEVNSGGPDPAVAWSWNFAAQSTTTGSPGKHTFSAIGNYSVTMSSTRQSGCTYSITKTIPIVQPPKASFSVFLEAGVSPFVVDFTNLSTNASSYLWQFGDKNNSISTAFSPSFTFADLGDYPVRLTATNDAGCSDIFTKAIQVVVPKMNASVSNFRLTKSAGSSFLRPEVTVQNNSNLAIIHPDIFLDISGRATITEKINRVIKPGESVNYTFLAQVDPTQVRYACADVRVHADENLYDNRDCISADEPRITLAPYPNPANDELTLEWIDQEVILMNVAIYNSAGQELLSKTYESGRKGLNQVKVDVSELQDGLYVVHCSVGIYRQSFRVVIER